MNTAKQDYYELLEVGRDASEQEIKAAYRKKAMEYHPDRNSNPQAEGLFKECAEAYEVLSNVEKRSLYDRFGHQGVAGQGFRDASDVFSSFSDMFEEFFSFGSSFSNGARSRQAVDLRYDLTIEFAEAVFGVEKEIKYPCQVLCSRCRGTKAEAGSKIETCGTCRGRGSVRRSQGFFSITTTCDTCRGQGRIVASPCSRCRGRGNMSDKRTINLKIPAGVDNNVKLRVGGAGEELEGERGDLYVFLRVRESKRYQRIDANLLAKENISIAQAALGCQLEVDTLQGKEKIKIHAGTQHGDLIKISGKGVPTDSYTGDLLIEVNIVVPRKLNKQQRQLLAEYAALSNEQVDKHDSLLHRMFSD